MKIGFK